MVLNDDTAGVAETDITSSITTVVFMLGYRTGLISCIMSLNVLGYLAFHFVAGANHLACRLGTPCIAGQSSVIFTCCYGVRYWAM